MTRIGDGPVIYGSAAPVEEPVEAPPEKELPAESTPQRAPDPFTFPKPADEPNQAPLPTPDPHKKWGTCRIPGLPNLDSL